MIGGGAFVKEDIPEAFYRPDEDIEVIYLPQGCTGKGSYDLTRHGLIIF
ncbi:hypothetical protein P4H61_05610 [Paenibacillus peoriae]|nr:hypothetical protein [Paenibacillus peoriae]MEC0180970.1 hypothetical protein [Paenibacillus peoriae]